MSPAVYLVLVVLVSTVGGVVVWARQRRPTSVESGIVEFRRSMDALAPRRRDDAVGDDADEPDRAALGDD